MSEDARFASAIQSINGALQRSHYTAQGDQNMTAVRFLPGHWDVSEDGESHGGGEHQHLVNYRYVGSTTTERNGNFVTEYTERFERRPDVDSVELPNDIWVAPIEAWRGIGNRNDPADPSGTHDPLDEKLLEGNIEEFALNPTATGENLLEADDFLVVFDPQTGVRAGRSLFQLKAYDPVREIDATDDGSLSPPDARKFMRASSEGVVIYRREPFVALGNAASGAVRQNALRRTGRPYFVHRLSGALVMGTQEE
jgi:hypothetical protein